MATVVAQHQINDPERFFGQTPEVIENMPPGVSARQFCPSQDDSRATCLGEADSIEARRMYLEPYSAGVCENTYYEVDEQTAFGLPEKAPACA